MRAAGIVGTGIYVPERVVTNFDLEKIVDTSDEWIQTRTGIRQRHHADEGLATSDMCVAAAEKALADAGVAAEEVDLVIVATVTPDMYFPATACLVQDRLGARRAGAFDLEAGCSGFMYGLSIGSQFIASGVYDTVLVIGAEILSRLLNWADRSTCVLFGDGAGAAVLRPVPEGYGIRSVVLGSDGAGGKLLNVPAGGSLVPPSRRFVDPAEYTIHMKGNEVFKFAVRVMGEAALEALQKAGWTREDLDYLIPHQANIRIIDAAVKRLGLPPEKAFVNVDRYGNISSASIPITLHEARRAAKLKKGDVVVMVAFGAGLTWAATAMRWWEEGGLP